MLVGQWKKKLLARAAEAFKSEAASHDTERTGLGLFVSYSAGKYADGKIETPGLGTSGTLGGGEQAAHSLLTLGVRCNYML